VPVRDEALHARALDERGAVAQAREPDRRRAHGRAVARAPGRAAGFLPRDAAAQAVDRLVAGEPAPDDALFPERDEAARDHGARDAARLDDRLRESERHLGVVGDAAPRAAAEREPALLREEPARLP